MSYLTEEMIDSVEAIKVMIPMVVSDDCIDMVPVSLDKDHLKKWIKTGSIHVKHIYPGAIYI